ncbi:hypothetical protein CEXT_11511 [Caerostris extrusa]|uniref:Uncharacterized protein n=1 Tax=Caerostris extrusa TaxID=172846 RepID=A0AAV4XH59_CAEEX|nr:hypothetical protein CEXT_11511 [Caerostris extrusa]
MAKAKTFRDFRRLQSLASCQYRGPLRFYQDYDLEFQWRIFFSFRFHAPSNEMWNDKASRTQDFSWSEMSPTAGFVPAPGPLRFTATIILSYFNENRSPLIKTYQDLERMAKPKTFRDFRRLQSLASCQYRGPLRFYQDYNLEVKKKAKRERISALSNLKQKRFFNTKTQ